MNYWYNHLIKLPAWASTLKMPGHIEKPSSKKHCLVIDLNTQIMVQKWCRATRLRRSKKRRGTKHIKPMQASHPSLVWLGKKINQQRYLNYIMLLAREYSFSEHVIVENMKCRPSRWYHWSQYTWWKTVQSWMDAFLN